MLMDKIRGCFILNPEVDYVIQQGANILPVEVKSGVAGSLKSLHQFVHDRQLPIAVRCDANPPSLSHVDVKTTTGEDTSYRLLSIPYYMIERLPELLGAVSEGAKV